MAQSSSVLDSIKNKLSQLNSTSQRRILVWRPESGIEAQVRIVPYKHASDPFNEMYFHYNMGNTKSVLCPQQTYGGSEKCPVCEYISELRQQPRTEKVTGELKTLSPKLRVFVPIIVRSREGEGVKFWGFGKQTYTDIAALFIDPEYGDISDVLKGRDLKVLRTAPNAKAMYGTVGVRPAANGSRLSENIDQMKAWVNDCPKISDAFEPLTYDGIAKVLDEYVNADEPTASQSPSQPTEEEVAEVAETPSGKIPLNAEDADVEDIDALFDNLGQVQVK